MFTNTRKLQLYHKVIVLLMDVLPNPAPTLFLTYIAGVVLEELEVLAATLAVVDHVFLQHGEDTVHNACHRPSPHLTTEPQTALDCHGQDVRETEPHLLTGALQEEGSGGGHVTVM